MISLIFGLVFLLFLGFMAFMVCGVIVVGGKAAIDAATKATPKQPVQVKADMLRYYQNGDFTRAQQMCNQLPDWEVSRQLRRTTAAHHEYHKRLLQAAEFLKYQYGFAQRIQESASLMPEYADLAGAIVGSSGHVNGQFRNLHRDSQQTFEARGIEMQSIFHGLCAMHVEVEKSYQLRDPEAAQLVSDSLAWQFAQLRGMNQAYVDSRRITGV